MIGDVVTNDLDALEALTAKIAGMPAPASDGLRERAQAPDDTPT